VKNQNPSIYLLESVDIDTAYIKNSPKP